MYYGCDYLDPSTKELCFLVVEADNDNQANNQAISELKNLHIPKRYIVKIEVLEWLK